jgi:hypothetical protein
MVKAITVDDNFMIDSPVIFQLTGQAPEPAVCSAAGMKIGKI